MSLSTRATALDRAQPRFNWIERIGLPITHSIMVAQPIGLAVTLLTLLVTGTSAAPSIPISQIVLLALGLLWWAMFVEALSSTRQWRKAAIAPLHIVGWLLAFVIILSPHLFQLLQGQDFLDLILAVMMVTLFWRQAIYHARIGFEYGDLTSSFKINLSFLLVLLLIAILIPQGQGILSALEGVFPLFFLSGIISLSLARLNSIRKARNAGRTQTDPSRTWLLVLTALSSLILTLVMVVNAFFSLNSLAFLRAALDAFWNILGIVVTWLLMAFFFLITPLVNLLRFLLNSFHSTSLQPKPKLPLSQSQPHKQTSPALSPELLRELLLIGRWVLVVLLFLIVFLIAWKSVQRWSKRDEETTIEEERETLDMRSALRERWQEWWNRHKKNSSRALEALDPTSIRARYRELLRALATADTTLARHLDETPREYEARLVTHLSEPQRNELKISAQVVGPTSKEMLHELTDAYTHERYGAAHIENQQRTRIATWIPRLTKQFTSQTSRIVARRPRHKLSTRS